MEVIHDEIKEPDFEAWKALGWNYVDHFGNAGFVFEDKYADPYDMMQLCIDFEDGTVSKEHLWLEIIGGEIFSRSADVKLKPAEQELADKELSK